MSKKRKAAIGGTAGALAGAAVAGPVGAVVGGAVGFIGGLFGNSSSGDSTDFTRYGDIMKVETTGASWQTAQQDKPSPKGGVRASETLAATDAKEMKDYRTKINSVGRRRKIDPALIAAIISRESRAGKALDDGWGDDNKAFGLMQVDVTKDGGNHKPEGDWDSEEHLDQATGILVYFIKRIQKKFPGWTKEQALKGGIAAYNKGDENVHSYEHVDARTTGGDYSNDVVARAQWYKNNKNY